MIIDQSPESIGQAAAVAWPQGAWSWLANPAFGPPTQQGFFGLLDFVGYPAASELGAPRRGGSYGGGRRFYMAQALDMAYRQDVGRSLLRQAAESQARLLLQVRLQEAEFEYQKKQMIGRMISTVLLSEL